MSRNFELLQNIGKEEEYFQPERVVVELAAPILLVYLFLQRHFVRGMLAGAIKE